MMTVVVTGACEVAGFALRVAMVNDPKLMYFVTMQFFLIVPPVLLAIVEYICVGRLLRVSAAAAAKRAAVRPGGAPPAAHARLAAWAQCAFTASDVFCLLLQAAGGGLAGSGDPSKGEMGDKLMLAGLSLQLAFFTLFTALACYVRLSPAHYGAAAGASPAGRRLRWLFACMYGTIVAMYVRNIFRVV